MATRQLRWTALWLTPEVIKRRADLWPALEQRVRDREMNTALRALSLSHSGRTGEAIQLISAAVKAQPDAQLEFFRAWLQRQSEERGEAVQSFIGSLISNPEAQATAAFGFTEDEPRWQIIRLSASLGKPRAALRLAEADARLKRRERGEPASASLSGAEPESQSRGPGAFQSLQARFAERQAKSQIDLLGLLSLAAEQVEDFNQAADFERARLSLLAAAAEKREAELRIDKLLARQRAKVGQKTITYIVDQRPVAQR